MIQFPFIRHVGHINKLLNSQKWRKNIFIFVEFIITICYIRFRRFYTFIHSYVHSIFINLLFDSYTLTNNKLKGIADVYQLLSYAIALCTVVIIISNEKEVKLYNFFVSQPQNSFYMKNDMQIDLPAFNNTYNIQLKIAQWNIKAAAVKYFISLLLSSASVHLDFSLKGCLSGIKISN